MSARCCSASSRTIYTLKLRSAFIRRLCVSLTSFLDMDPEKVSAVHDFPRPENRKQLQQFLCFANFYRHFINNFSSIAAPLHILTSSQTHFLWNDTTEAACKTLRKFTSALAFTIPGPKLQFIVEIDA